MYKMIDEKLSEKKLLIAAHQGSYGGNILSNTILSGKNALLHGADIIEADVTMNMDKTLYIFHEGNMLEIIPFGLGATSAQASDDVANCPSDWNGETRTLRVNGKIAIYDPSLRESVYVGELEDIPDYVNTGKVVKIIARYRSFNYQEIVVLKDSSVLQ